MTQRQIKKNVTREMNLLISLMQGISFSKRLKIAIRIILKKEINDRIK